MSYGTKDDIDELVEDVLLPILRRGSFPLSSLSLVNLSLIDKTLAERLALRIGHLYYSDDTDVSSSKYSKLIKECVAAVKHGVPEKSIETLTKSIETKNPSLIPFLIASFSGDDVSLRGFSSKEKTFWFASSDDDKKNRFPCFSEKGSVRFVSVGKLEEKGFSEISGNQQALMKQCKSEVLSNSSKQDILTAGVYVSGKVQPIVFKSRSEDLLSKFVSKIPGIGEKPDKKLNVTPKF